MSSDLFVTTLQEWMKLAMRRSMRHFLRFARESGLSISHFGAIFYIHRCGSCGVTEIGEHLGVTSAAASQMLDRLVEQGLVLRTEDTQDRRVKRIELTARGQEVFEGGVQARQGWLDELADKLSNEEKRSIAAALQVMIQKANELSSDAVAEHQANR